MVKQILLGASVAWSGATLLALLYASCVSGRLSFDTLRLPGVVSVALLISAGIALLMTPLVVWAFKSGEKSLIAYGGALFALLVVYMVGVAPSNPAFGLYGSVLLGIVGLIIIGLIHR